MHPQYVLENGVDFAHFKFVHQTPIVPVFTRHDFDEPVSYVDFTITFEGDDKQTIDDVKSGVEAINGGLGIAVTKSWGWWTTGRSLRSRPLMRARPMSASWSTSAVARHGIPKAEAKAREFGDEVIRQFTQDSTSGDTNAIRIRPRWRVEQQGFTALRNWAKQFYPEGPRGGAPPKSTHRKVGPNESNRKPIRVFQVATGNVGWR